MLTNRGHVIKIKGKTVQLTKTEVTNVQGMCQTCRRDDRPLRVESFCQEASQDQQAIASTVQRHHVTFDD